MADILKDRVAIVTGSGAGIGKALAIAMAKESARLLTNDVRPGIAESTAKEITDMGRYGVTCNAIAPVAATRMGFIEGLKDEFRKRFEAGLITRQQYEGMVTDVPGPEYVPPIVVYLASDEASNINGQIFSASGVPLVFTHSRWL